MDPSSACRLSIRVPAYVEQRPDGLGDYHVTQSYMRVVDKDIFNWMGFRQLLGEEIVHGQDQDLHVSFFDTTKNETVHINSDSALLHAFDVYWDSRKLPLTVDVIDTTPWNTARVDANPVQHANPVEHDNLADDENVEVAMPLDVIYPDNLQAPTAECPSGNTEPDDTADVNAHDTVEFEADDIADHDESDESDESADAQDDENDDWGEKDEVEYVGVDDEKEKYHDELNDDGQEDCSYYPDTDPEDDDPLEVDDERGCESVLHVTDVDNPKIAVGVTFEDGLCFKRCIRQYAVLNEVELAVPYSESRRYRAYCKAERCRWRIHASQLSDGKTWQVCTFSLLVYAMFH